jgi:hypothetical protein
MILEYKHLYIIDELPYIEVPLHTILKLTPVRFYLLLFALSNVIVNFIQFLC